MRRLMVLAAAAALVAAGCGDSEQVSPPEPPAVEEPAPPPEPESDSNREPLDAAGGFLSPGSGGDRADGLPDIDDVLDAWEAEMVASMPQRDPYSDPAAYIAALQGWATEQRAAIRGGDPTALDKQIDDCVLEAFTAAVSPGRLDVVVESLGQVPYGGIPTDAVTGEEMADFVEVAGFCGPLLAADAAPAATSGQGIMSQELLTACEAALAADPAFVETAAQAVMFDAADEAFLAMDLAETLCDPLALRSSQGPDRPVYTPGDDPAAYIDLLLAWATDSLAALAGFEVTDQTRALDSCLAASVAGSVSEARLAEIAAAFDAAGDLTAAALTSDEMTAFAQGAAAGCGELLMAETDAVLDELLDPTGTTQLSGSVSAELTAARDSCITNLTNSRDYLPIAAQASTFADTSAQNETAQIWGELCSQYLTLAVTEQLVAAGVPPETAECVAPALLEQFGTLEATEAALDAIFECGFG